jgi:hypothetical protein
MKRIGYLRSLFVAVGLIAFISCTTDQALAPAPQQQLSADTAGINPDLLGGVVTTLTRTVTGLLTCQPERFASGSGYIGRNGGTIRLGDHTLYVPAGALDHTVFISGQVVSDTVNSVRLFPEGLQFAQPAQLTMSYDNCGLLASLTTTLGLTKPIRIAYTSDNLRIISWVRSDDDRQHKTVKGYLDHFSRYAVGW